MLNEPVGRFVVEVAPVLERVTLGGRPARLGVEVLAAGDAPFRARIENIDGLGARTAAPA
jgi:hypothetical protein